MAEPLKAEFEEDRFRFGLNWSNFLKTVTEKKISEAQCSLCTFLGLQKLNGASFLDIGSGSGLFSLAARRLGATVHSFDYDLESVACTQELRNRFLPGDPEWKVDHGSVLDKAYLAGLGRFDIVYSWGVLHHSGAMWQALENTLDLVKPGGRLFIAIYNDQGPISGIWKAVKKLYNSSPAPIKTVLVLLFFLIFEIQAFFSRIITFRNPLPFRRWSELTRARGMSIWHDVVDWVGGYPFEVAKPEEIFDFYKKHGFRLEKLVTQRGNHGCCEYLFTLERPS